MSPPPPSQSHPEAQQLPPIHDILIIGAGPSALAVAARLRENTPSALYTDEEHRRFHFLRQRPGSSSVKDKRTGATKLASRPPHHRASDLALLVLDAEGPAWMARWDRLFAALRIQFLRSPMFFHPDPSDRDALRAFAHERGREGEVREIRGVVGREVSKHGRKKTKERKKKKESGKGGCAECERRAGVGRVNERERSDYFTPSAGLFGDFVGAVEARYGLLEDEGMVQRARVEDVGYAVVPALDEQEKLFAVRADTGVHYARAVVLAVGAGNAPVLPAPFPPLDKCGEGACHALHLTSGDFLPQRVKQKIKDGRETNVVVIGGGLTSAQVADLCVEQGVARVWMLTRGPLKVKPFDVDVSWMGKFRNQEKAAFWMADDDFERAEMLRQARGGGSVTPRFGKVLQTHVQSRRLSVLTNTVVDTASYSSATSTWTLATKPPVADMPEIDYIIFATGVASDISTLPFLQTLHRQHPIETIEGLPALTDDLQWKDDVPLFVTGKFAGLRLGPGAANLEGARAGAERVALGLRDVLGRDRGGGGEGKGGERRDSGFEMAEKWRRGEGGRYEVLGEE